MKIYINNIEVEVSNNSTVLEACSTIGIDIPRFCYHQELSVAGNCRMCLVEIEKAPKPVASCAFPVTPNMKVFTDTPLVKKAREGVLEFLLLNHPLDCPICDQGGECDLQEQVMVYGSDRSRFYEMKRSVEDKNCGPLIKTIMTRCIHCTRCVRFGSEVGGVTDLGTTNRGQDTEIGTFINKTLQTELSGNLIDLCPVGALTSKPYAFKCRPWEIRSVDSIDVFDGVGSNIRIDFKESEIVRILPRINRQINKEWITDKVRFSYDGLKTQRITQPFQKINQNWDPVSWPTALQEIKSKFFINPTKIGMVVGTSVDAETLVSLKEVSSNLNITKLVTDRFQTTNMDFVNNYSLNLEKVGLSDCCLLVGTDPKFEANLLNLRLQQSNKRKNTSIFSIGSPSTATWSPNFLGITLQEFVNFLEGKHPACGLFKKSKSPLVIYGSGVLDRLDSTQLHSTIQCFNKNVEIIDQSHITLLNSESNQVGTLNMGIQSCYPEFFNNLEVLYLIQPSFKFLTYLKNLKPSIPFIVCQDHHFPALEFSKIMSMMLPGKTFVEKEGHFFNIENRCQKTSKVFNNVLNIQNRDDWQILQMLKNNEPNKNYYWDTNNNLYIESLENNCIFRTYLDESLNECLSVYNLKTQTFEFYKKSTLTLDWEKSSDSSQNWIFDLNIMKNSFIKNQSTYFSFDELQNKLRTLIPNSSQTNNLVSSLFSNTFVFNGIKVHKTHLKPLISDFYLTHTISQNSIIMGKCSSNKRKLSSNYLVL